MDLEINTLSLKELKDLKSQVDRALATFEDRRKKEALSELEEKARALGFSLAELTGMAISRKRPAAAARFANPANPSDTWSGRGRKPRWFIEAIASGKSEADLEL